MLFFNPLTEFFNVSEFSFPHFLWIFFTFIISFKYLGHCHHFRWKSLKLLYFFITPLFFLIQFIFSPSDKRDWKNLLRRPHTFATRSQLRKIFLFAPHIFVYMYFFDRGSLHNFTLTCTHAKHSLLLLCGAQKWCSLSRERWIVAPIKIIAEVKCCFFPYILTFKHTHLLLSHPSLCIFISDSCMRVWVNVMGKGWKFTTFPTESYFLNHLNFYFPLILDKFLLKMTFAPHKKIFSLLSNFIFGSSKLLMLTTIKSFKNIGAGALF